MVIKSEDNKDINEGNKNIFKTCEDSYTAISTMWEDSYLKLYRPWLGCKGELFEKAVELSTEAKPQKFQEFYIMWLDTYQETYGRLFDTSFMLPSKNAFESFVRNASIDLNLYRSWIAALEKLSQKAMELSKQKADRETCQEFYNLWAKTYKKAFENFFESTLSASQFKEIMQPVKNAARIYADTFTRISSHWMKSYAVSASAV